MRFQVVLEPSGEGGYTVYVPSLPGCISEGDTVEDAPANIRVTTQASGWNRAWGAKAGCPPAWTRLSTQVDARLQAL